MVITRRVIWRQATAMYYHAPYQRQRHPHLSIRTLSLTWCRTITTGFAQRYACHAASNSTNSLSSSAKPKFLSFSRRAATLTSSSGNLFETVTKQKQPWKMQNKCPQKKRREELWINQEFMNAKSTKIYVEATLVATIAHWRACRPFASQFLQFSRPSTISFNHPPT